MPGRINSPEWLQRPSAIKWGNPSVPHKRPCLPYLSNLACVLPICCSNAKYAGEPGS